ncbi:hypothetical protein GDO81_006876 [Engystomops pustulosus]|uniref:Uncharacterized protein n=1 Tax=Engystomops pustulosus TaxID=76066 RepID=A0AAV7D248_ENGPU|nr:hypothetical protein GDO81_006876 [Engystomops pustulosus]
MKILHRECIRYSSNRDIRTFRQQIEELGKVHSVHHYSSCCTERAPRIHTCGDQYTPKWGVIHYSVH